MIEIDAKIYDRQVLDLPRLSLFIGDWRHSFREEEYKLIIAKALNQCTDQQHCLYEIEDPETETDRVVPIYIVGYLITNQMLHLVLFMEADLRPEEVEELMRLLVRNLNKKLQATVNRINSIKNYHTHGVRVADVGDIIPGGFTAFKNFRESGAFNNISLVKLITGYEVQRPYYDPQLARLKGRLQHYPFCSLLDYEGAKSAVIVKKLMHHNHL